MDARGALSTLKELLNDGFITKAEFHSRRQAILDKVTSVDTSAILTSVEPAKPSSVFDRLGASQGPSQSSVFDRLNQGTSGGRANTVWGHDGYFELYGGRSKERPRPAAPDLREKLSAIRKKPKDIVRPGAKKPGQNMRARKGR